MKKLVALLLITLNISAVEIDPSLGKSFGNPKSAVQVVEFQDLDCPHCRHFLLEKFPEIKKKYIDEGKIYYTFINISLRNDLSLLQKVDAATDFLQFATDYFKITDKTVEKQLPLSPEFESKQLRIKSLIKDLQIEHVPTFFINKEKLDDTKALLNKIEEKINEKK